MLSVFMSMKMGMKQCTEKCRCFVFEIKRVEVFENIQFIQGMFLEISGSNWGLNSDKFCIINF